MNQETFTPTPPNDGKSWFLRVPYGKLPRKVILTLLLDIPTESILSQMENVQKISEFGEYIVYSGKFEGEEIGIVYHGSGSFSISTAIEELVQLGVTCMLRIGNSGGLSDTVHVGNYIIADGAVREDRLMLDYVPAEFPAIADFNMIESARAACSEIEGICHEGLVLSVATFYPGSGYPTAKGVFESNGVSRVHLWKKAGILTMDVETSTVLIMGRLFGIRSGSILGVGNHATFDEGSYMSPESTRKLALLGLRTIRGCVE